jgi:hypothetical protein
MPAKVEGKKVREEGHRKCQGEFAGLITISRHVIVWLVLYRNW